MHYKIKAENVELHFFINYKNIYQKAHVVSSKVVLVGGTVVRF